MGTQIQIESNLSAHFQMRDLNEASNGYSWPVFYGDKALSNGHYQNGVLPRATAEAYLGYDREIVRQTMIEHETVFRNQVFELHRLYRIQRDLMDEIRRRELNISRMPVETSLTTSPLASQVTCEGTRKWHIPSSPIASTSQARPSLSNTDHIHSPMSSRRGDTVHTASAFPSPNGGSLKTSEVLESKPSKFRRTFDLQLPADEYIDSDEQEQAKDALAEKGKFRFPEFGKGSGVNLFNGHDRMEEYSSRSREVADLNQPILVEETSTSHSDTQDPSAKPKSLLIGLPHENSENSLRGSTEQQGRVWLPHVLETGDSKSKRPFPDGGWLGKYTSSQPMQGLFNSAYVRANENKLGNKVERSISDLRVSKSFKSSESVLGSQPPSQYQIAPKPWPQSLSSWEKSGNSLCPKLMSVQMHPYLDTSASCSKTSHQASQSYGIFADKWHERNAMSNPTFGNGLPYQNGFYCGYSSGSKEQSSPFNSTVYPKCGNGGSAAIEELLKSESGVNLNVVPKIGSLEEINGERKKDSLITLPWLRPKSSVVRRDQNESENSRMQRFSQDLNSVSSSHGADTKRVENGGEYPSDRRIFECPVFERPTPKNDPCSHNSPSMSPCHSEGGAGSERKMILLDINLPCDPIPEETTEDVVAEKGSDSKCASCRHEIDLNSCLSDDESVLLPSVVIPERKVVPVIDLEVPAVPENEEDVFTVQVLEQNLETSINSSLQLKTEDQPEVILKGAAEAIVAISLASYHDSLDNATCSSRENPKDVLNWFADAVLGCGNGTESRSRAAAYSESTSKEIDYFELMTLQLTETKPEDFLPEPFGPEIIDVDESAAGTTTVSNRPRRGQARRGRQRRDFQRDILPGLTSLSRHEVTEDLQTFGGMMRATGYSWQSGLCRRNSSRGGQGRGRRRGETVSPSTSAVVNTAAPTCTPLIQQLNHFEVGGGLEERSLTGWGKTPRRPRRQRCPTSNTALLHLT